MFIAQPSEAI